MRRRVRKHATVADRWPGANENANDDPYADEQARDDGTDAAADAKLGWSEPCATTCGQHACDLGMDQDGLEDHVQPYCQLRKCMDWLGLQARRCYDAIHEWC